MSRFTIYADNTDKGYPTQIEADDVFSVEKYPANDGIDRVRIGYYQKIKKDIICRETVQGVNDVIEKYKTVIIEKDAYVALKFIGTLLAGIMVGYLFKLIW